MLFKEMVQAVSASVIVPRSRCQLHSEPIPCYAFRCGIHCILNTLIPSVVFGGNSATVVNE